MAELQRAPKAPARAPRANATDVRTRVVGLERRIRASVGAARALGFIHLAELLQERAAVLAELSTWERSPSLRVVEAEIVRAEHALGVWESVARY